MTLVRGLASLIAASMLAAGLAACGAPPIIPPPSTPSATPSTTAADTHPGVASGTPTPSATASGSPKTAAPSPPTKPGAKSPSTAPTSGGDPTPGTGEGSAKATPKPEAKPKPEQTTPAPKPKPTTTASGRWKPPARPSWQWQLSGTLNTGVNADVYDVDLFDTSAAQVKQLHSQGRKVICYFSAGSYESGRPDSGDFPAAVKGKKMDGWPEYWLDVRDPKVLTIMAARMDLCAKKGFDGVEPDNVDGYQNNSGFPLTASDQLAYNKALAKLAHDRGLAVGLKNDLDQVKALQPSFDFAVNEECYAWNECSMLTPFINAGKPVFHVEYEGALSTFCPTTTKLGFSSMLKNYDLDATRKPCP